MQKRTSMLFEFDSNSGILFISPPEDFEGPETIEIAKENLHEGLRLSGDELKGIIAQMPNHYVNAETTRYYRENAPEVPIAMVGASFFQKMMGNFMMAVAKPKRPTRFFSNEAEAIAWLKELIKTPSSEN